MPGSFSFSTVVYIESDEIDNLNSKTECLRCILENADIEAVAKIDFDYDSGYQGSWEEPPRDAQAEYINIEHHDFKIHSVDKDAANAIRVLMTKEQREAVLYLVEYIIERDWDEVYEEQAFDSMPHPEDYVD